jgi:hypothetical protein
MIGIGLIRFSLDIQDALLSSGAHRRADSDGYCKISLGWVKLKDAQSIHLSNRGSSGGRNLLTGEDSFTNSYGGDKIGGASAPERRVDMLSGRLRSTMTGCLMPSFEREIMEQQEIRSKVGPVETVDPTATFLNQPGNPGGGVRWKTMPARYAVCQSRIGRFTGIGPAHAAVAPYFVPEETRKLSRSVAERTIGLSISYQSHSK